MKVIQLPLLFDIVSHFSALNVMRSNQIQFKSHFEVNIHVASKSPILLDYLSVSRESIDVRRSSHFGHF